MLLNVKHGVEAKNYDDVSICDSHIDKVLMCNKILLCPEVTSVK